MPSLLLVLRPGTNFSHRKNLHENRRVASQASMNRNLLKHIFLASFLGPVDEASWKEGCA